eukprot:TRINITY_DN9990_c0_g2_i2.p1 TRINITY_DN9990_c0_g2~~TRINITY_DN9990_c0_g2_i2.p1  ORF type:complete len:171 (-),score=23.48 TRINITY_DN9990_c0_g2_i2:31-543(-)
MSLLPRTRHTSSAFVEKQVSRSLGTMSRLLVQVCINPIALKECLDDDESRRMVAAIGLRAVAKLIKDPSIASSTVKWDTEPFQRVSEEELHVQQLRQAREAAPAPTLPDDPFDLRLVSTDKYLKMTIQLPAVSAVAEVDLDMGSCDVDPDLVVAKFVKSESLLKLKLTRA